MANKTVNYKNTKNSLSDEKFKFPFPFKKYLKNHPTWNTRASSYPHLLNTIVPLVAVLLVFVVGSVLVPHFFLDSPYLAFFVAIMISAWYGGFKSAFLATIFSAILINFVILKHQFPFGIENREEYIKTILYILEGSIVSILSQFMHNALKKSEIKNMELRRSEEQHRLIVESVKDYAIFTLDADGYITSWNQGAQRINGYRTDEIIGKHFSVFYPEDEVKQRNPWNILQLTIKNGRHEHEGWLVKKNKATYWADVVVTTLKDDKGKLHGFSQIIRDMTIHKELDKRKDEFISIASHELKTPVTSVKVFNQIMQKTSLKRNDQEFLQYLNRMDRQINRLTEIITDLLDVSKIQAGKLEFNKELFDMNELVNETVENMQNVLEKHSIIVKGKATKNIFGDKDRIGQVLINFLTNAIKYSPNADKVIVKIIPQDNSITIGVQDFGIGISTEHLDKIFEPFYRVYNEAGKTFPGLGMGLHISQDIINRHDGTIWAESEIDQGSTFYFTLSYNKGVSKKENNKKANLINKLNFNSGFSQSIKT